MAIHIYDIAILWYWGLGTSRLSFTGDWIVMRFQKSWEDRPMPYKAPYNRTNRKPHMCVCAAQLAKCTN